MAQTNEISLRITVDGASAKTGIDQVGRHFDGLKNNIAGIERTTTALTSSISRMGHAAAAFASINFGASGLIQAADAWNSINAQLKIATGSAQEGAKAYQSVLAIAQQTGQAIDDVSTVYRRFAENSTALGISQKQVADITTTVSQAIAISGGSAASAQAALTQFGQALASGQLRGEELNSVLEQAPRLARALADGLGVPIGKLRELAAEGAITSEALVDALGKSAGKVADEFGQLPVTVARSLTNIKTAWTDTVGSLEKGSGAFSALASGLDGVAKNMDVIAAAGGTLAAVMLGRVVSSTVAATGASITAAAAKRNLAAAEVQAAQAALAAATSRAANLGVMASETAATAALAAAHQRLATATASAAAASRGAMVIGALGGPIGIITTALTVGITAWQMWSSKTEETTADAARSVAQNIDAIIGKIEEMNGRLGDYTRKAYESILTAAEAASSQAATEIAALKPQVEALRKEVSKGDDLGGFFGIGLESKRAELKQLTKTLEELGKHEIGLQRQLGEARARSAEVGLAALDRFVEANAVGAEKISVKQSQLLQDFSRSIADTGGVLDLNIAAHKKAYDALNAGLAEIEKSGTKGGGSKDRERIAAEALRVIKDGASAEVEIIREKVAQNLLTERGGAEKTLEIQTAAIEAQKKILEQRLSKSSGADAAQIKSQLADLGRAAEIAAEKARTAFHKLDQQEREAYRSSVAALAQQTDELLKKAAASEEELATIGLSADELARLTSARYDEQIALLETEAARLRDAEGREAEVYLIEQQIAAMQRLKSAEVTRPRLEAQSRAWENFSRDIERSLTDSLYRSFEAGGNFGKTFADTLKNSLKTIGIKFAVQMLVQPVMTGLAGMFGGNGQDGGQQRGENGELLGYAKQGYDILNMGNTISKAGSMVGNGISYVGNATGSAAMSGFGAGFSSGVGEAMLGNAFVGPSASLAGNSSIAAGSNAGSFLSSYGGYLAAGLQLLQGDVKGAAWTAAGTAVGSVFGPVGAGIGAVVGSLLGGIFGGGGEQYKRQVTSSYGEYTNGKFSDYGADPNYFPSSKRLGESTDDALAMVNKQYSQTLGALFKAFDIDEQIKTSSGFRLRRTSGKWIGGMTATVGDKQFIASGVEGGGDSEGLDTVLADFAEKALSSGIVAAIKDSKLPDEIENLFDLSMNADGVNKTIQSVIVMQGALKAADSSLVEFAQSFKPEDYAIGMETIAETTSRLALRLLSVNDVFSDLNLQAFALTGAGGNLASTLVDLMGGVEGFTSATTGYYENYFSQEERMDDLRRRATESLAQVGLALPESREAFRALVESLDLTTDSGQSSFAALMKVQGAFAQLTDAASTSAQKMADAARSLLAQQVTGQIGTNVAGWNAAADAGLAALERAAQRELARAQAEQQQRQSEMDASREAHNAVINSRIDMEQTRKQLAADSLSAARERASVVARISDVSGRAAADLYRGSDSVGPAQAAAALRQVADMASAARRGALPNADQLARLITSAQSGIGKDGASYYETERDKLVLAGHLSQIEASAGKQLPAAEQAVALAQKQLDSAAEQIELLRKQLITQTASVELDQRAVTAANQALEAYSEQINRLRGVESATWSIDGTVEDVGKRIVAGLQAQAKTITDSIQAALAAQNISSKDAGAAFQQLPTASGVMVSNNGAVIAGNKVYRADGVVATTTQAGAEIYGAKREKSAQDFYSWAISAGYSGAMIEKLVGLPSGDMAKWAKANGLPAFAVGTDRVPADMLAMVHQGERITPAAYTGQQERLIADLITEVRRLQAIVASGNAEARRTADAVNGRPEAPLLVEMA